MSGKADKTYVDTQLSTKADSSQITTLAEQVDQNTDDIAAINLSTDSTRRKVKMVYDYQYTPSINDDLVIFENGIEAMVMLPGGEDWIGKQIEIAICSDYHHSYLEIYGQDGVIVRGQSYIYNYNYDYSYMSVKVVCISNNEWIIVSNNNNMYY
ncbi:MAG: hypothetical protein ABIH86_06985 [Planctomycetota bacterium]